MEILDTNCAGVEVPKQTVKVCLLTRTSDGQLHQAFRTYLTTTEELGQLGDWLKEQGCTHLADRGHQGCIGSRCVTCWKAVFQCWSSMRSSSKRCRGERRM